MSELTFIYQGQQVTTSQLKRLLPFSEEYQQYKSKVNCLYSNISKLEDKIEKLREELEELTSEWEPEERRLGLIN